MVSWKVEEDWKQRLSVLTGEPESALEKKLVLDNVPLEVATGLIIYEGRRSERIDMHRVLSGTQIDVTEYLRISKRRKLISRTSRSMRYSEEPGTAASAGFSEVRLRLEQPTRLEPYELVIRPGEGVSLVATATAGLFPALKISYGMDGSSPFIRVVPEYLLPTAVEQVKTPETFDGRLEFILKKLSGEDFVSHHLGLGSGVKLEIAETYVSGMLDKWFEAHIQAAQASEALTALPNLKVRAELAKLLTEGTSSNLSYANESLTGPKRRPKGVSVTRLLQKAFDEAVKDLALAFYEDEGIPQHMMRIHVDLYPVGNAVVETPRPDRAKFSKASGLLPGVISDLGMIVLTDFSFGAVTYKVGTVGQKIDRDKEKVVVSLSDETREGKVQFPLHLPSDAAASLMHDNPITWVKAFMDIYNSFTVCKALYSALDKSLLS